MSPKIECINCGKRYDPLQKSTCPLCRFDPEQNKQGVNPKLDEELQDTSPHDFFQVFEEQAKNREKPVIETTRRTVDRGVPIAQREPSILSLLFDVKFKEFIFIRVASIQYTIWIIIVGLGLLGLEILGFWGLFDSLVRGNSTYILFSFAVILIAPLLAILFLLIIRLAFESGIALIKIAQNTARK